MTFKIMWRPVAIAVLAASLGSCVDDNYDLSDIDTTTELKVTDLVLPVNIDPVTLSDIITFDEDSKIQPITIDGTEYYALSDTGSFFSKPIHIDKVSAEAPHLAYTERDLDQVISESPAQRRAGEVADDYTCRYEIVEMGNDFNYSASDIDPAIVELKSAEVEPLKFHVHLQAINAVGKVEKMYFDNLVITMPKGLTASASNGKYDPETGLWTIAHHDVNGEATTDAELTATAIDFVAAGCQITPNHTMDFEGSFRVQSGTLTIEPKWENGVPVPLPDKLKFRVDYTLNDMVINTLTGTIHYTLNGMDVDPVSLSDIPDFLNNDQTTLGLANPQIFIQVNNPVANYDLKCRAGIALTPIRNGVGSTPLVPNDLGDGNDGRILIGSEAVAGYSDLDRAPRNFVLSPLDDQHATPASFADFADFNNPTAKWVEFTDLRNLLYNPDNASEKGIPSEIGITLEDPEIYTQPVKDFRLGTDIVGISGKYGVVAPLALTSDSEIVYSEIRDGWNDEDVDAITITKLSLTATVDNGAPLSAKLVAYPLDVNGKRISGVEVTSNLLEANTDGQQVVIEMTGTIQHLDGVEFVATLLGSSKETALAPSQTITLSNVKAKVSGSYIREL